MMHDVTRSTVPEGWQAVLSEWRDIDLPRILHGARPDPFSDRTPEAFVLTKRQSRVWRAMARRLPTGGGQINLHEVARELDLNPRTIHSAVDALVEKGYLARRGAWATVTYAVLRRPPEVTG